MKAEFAFALAFALYVKRLTVCVTGRWAGVDSASEQEKLEARKMLENGDESHLSRARGVRPHRSLYTSSLKMMYVAEYLDGSKVITFSTRRAFSVGSRTSPHETDCS
jgi:hypothetical protein